MAAEVAITGRLETTMVANDVKRPLLRVVEDSNRERAFDSSKHVHIQKGKDRLHHFSIPLTIVKIYAIYRNLLHQCHMFVKPYRIC